MQIQKQVWIIIFVVFIILIIIVKNIQSVSADRISYPQIHLTADRRGPPAPSCPIRKPLENNLSPTEAVNIRPQPPWVQSQKTVQLPVFCQNHKLQGLGFFFFFNGHTEACRDFGQMHMCSEYPVEMQGVKLYHWKVGGGFLGICRFTYWLGVPEQG